MNYLQKLTEINRHRRESPIAERICSELVYLDGVSRNANSQYNGILETAYDYLLSEIDRDGVITKSALFKTEEMLSNLVVAAKRYKALFVAHAHIDMNWMWGYQETAAITIDTFRTILNLMDEYPEFTFAQSQASTYEIVEKYAPELLDPIRRRIKEGRWEVTASEWVEPDKNMPDGESLTRQILQTKKYLSKLLSIDPKHLNIDFVPDTFGHSANVPEILCNAGVRYLYHCRGFETPSLYYFVAPSGKRVLTYRENEWYNGSITPQKFEIVPSFCGEHQIQSCLCVYGVGDHGGGPSRRDIERILRFRSWPLTPDIRFGSFHEFFSDVENSGVVLPEIKHELNCVFTGCYTTQSRIKMANRVAESRMNEAEVFGAMASQLSGAPRAQGCLDIPWRQLLFNQFHDILPGSGTIETREYAMGKFQEILTVAGTRAGFALQNLAQNMDTSSIPLDDDPETCSEGGGVGFLSSQSSGFKMPSAERGRGKVRIFHVFNPTAYERTELTELTVWDYPYDLSQLAVCRADGSPLEYVVTETNRGYWDHQYTKLEVLLTVPAYGYTTVVLRQKIPDGHLPHIGGGYLRNDDGIHDLPIVLENENLKAIFDASTMQLFKLIDKKSGESLIQQPSCYFDLIQENPRHQMTSWRVGPHMKTVNLNATQNVKVTEYTQNSLFQRVCYEIKFGRSFLKAIITLKKNSCVLEYALRIDWQEMPTRGETIPQLCFQVPVSYATSGKAFYEIPYGIIERPPIAHDVPSLSFLSVDGSSQRNVGIIADVKYGFRFYDNCGSVTLLRSAYDPDPYPDQGIHTLRLGVASAVPEDMKELSDRFCHPLSFVSGSSQKGFLPLEGQALSVVGDVTVSCFKNSEDDSGVVVRLVDMRGRKQRATLTFSKPIKSAYISDIHEHILEALSVNGDSISVVVPAYSLTTLKVDF